MAGVPAAPYEIPAAASCSPLGSIAPAVPLLPLVPLPASLRECPSWLSKSTVFRLSLCSDMLGTVGPTSHRTKDC